jgi:hypothetical protein
MFVYVEYALHPRGVRFTNFILHYCTRDGSCDGIKELDSNTK